MFIVAMETDSLTDPSTFLSRQVEASQVFFFDDSEASDFDVRCGGFERCQPNYRIDRPGFPWFLLEFVHGGRGTLILDGNESPLKPGMFFLYGPGIEHHIAAIRTNRCSNISSASRDQAPAYSSASTGSIRE